VRSFGRNVLEEVRNMPDLSLADSAAVDADLAVAEENLLDESTAAHDESTGVQHTDEDLLSDDAPAASQTAHSVPQAHAEPADAPSGQDEPAEAEDGGDDGDDFDEDMLKDD
jgi:hypothetical protein